MLDDHVGRGEGRDAGLRDRERHADRGEHRQARMGVDDPGRSRQRRWRQEQAGPSPIPWSPFRIKARLKGLDQHGAGKHDGNDGRNRADEAERQDQRRDGNTGNRPAERHARLLDREDQRAMLGRRCAHQDLAAGRRVGRQPEAHEQGPGQPERNGRLRQERETRGDEDQAELATCGWGRDDPASGRRRPETSRSRPRRRPRHSRCFQAPGPSAASGSAQAAGSRQRRTNSRLARGESRSRRSPTMAASNQVPRPRRRRLMPSGT